MGNYYGKSTQRINSANGCSHVLNKLDVNLMWYQLKEKKTENIWQYILWIIKCLKIPLVSSFPQHERSVQKDKSASH